MNAEKDNSIPSIANSISLFENDASADIDHDINSAMYKHPSKFGRSLSQEESASTESGDEDSSVRSTISLGFTSRDSEAGDDDKSLSPRSSTSDAATCVYSVMLLLRLRASARFQGSRSTLGYRTEPAPGQAARASPSIGSSRSSPKHSSKARVTPVSARPSRSSLPAASAESWTAKQRTNAAKDDDDAKVVRAARAILNKLTLEKFQSLFEQLVACGIANSSHISMLMREVFEKATTQHQFIPMYAELCVRLEQDPHISSVVEEAGQQNNFRRLLLNQCQEVFEQLLEPCGKETDVHEELRARRKQQAIGNIKLIGELIVQGMLCSDLFNDCGNQLLQSRMTCPDALECLAALMMVAGPKFDTSTWRGHSKFEALLSDMEQLIADKSTPARLRFLLRDVLDARSAGWSASVNQTALKAAPMTLEEVREKVAEEQAVSSPKRQTNSPSMVNSFSGGKAGAKVGKNGKPRTPTQSPTTTPSSSAVDVCISAFKSAVAPAHGRQDHAKAAAAKKNVPAPTPPASFDLGAFRRTTAATLVALASDKNVPAAVQQVRAHQVPVQNQRDEICDLLSRIVEERRGVVRRCQLAFVAGLVAAEDSAFDRTACLDGIRLFFEDVYAEMCTEVQRLPAIMRSEFVPTMHSVFPSAELNVVLPDALRT